MTEDRPAPEQDKTPESQFATEKVYIKDASFESPNSPAAFAGEWKPKISVELASSGSRAGDDMLEVVLHLTVTVKLADTTAYLAEVHQAGIFTISGTTPEQHAYVQHVNCPSILYPYACAAITDLVSKGGFPQLLLSPFNFHSMYLQHKQDAGRQEPPASE